jgi:uncharacterized protein (DUF1330 family)
LQAASKASLFFYDHDGFTSTGGNQMMKLKLAFAMLLGAAVGIGAIEILHAQAKPPAYLIADITVNNETLFKEWADKINPTFAQFGAKYLVRGGQTIVIPSSGEPPKRTVLIVFESLDKAKAWNESDAVKQARSMPDRGAKFHSWLVEGAQ